MTVGELRVLLQSIPDSTPIAVEYDMGVFTDKVDARLDKGHLILDTDPDTRRPV